MNCFPQLKDQHNLRSAGKTGTRLEGVRLHLQSFPSREFYPPWGLKSFHGLSGEVAFHRVIETAGEVGNGGLGWIRAHGHVRAVGGFRRRGSLRPELFGGFDGEEAMP